MATNNPKILLTFGDGSVGIMTIALELDGYVPPNLPGWYEERRVATAAAVEHEIVRACFEKSVASWRYIGDADVPPDRSYRDAWVDDGKVIAHDMAKARDIYRQRVRSDRAGLLAALDVEYMRADESGDDDRKVAVAQVKQRLRRAPEDPRIDACGSVEELRALDVLQETAIDARSG